MPPPSGARPGELNDALVPADPKAARHGAGKPVRRARRLCGAAGGAHLPRPIVASVGTGISGFAAPIGGYHWHRPGVAGETAAPTALPIWTQLRRAGRVVTAVHSVPCFHGTHGHDSRPPSMSAILYAAGPHIARGRTLEAVSNLDVAPTVMRTLGVPPATTVEGRVIPGLLRDDRP